MGRRVPGSPRRRRVENPNRRDGHACPSPGNPSAPLGLRPAPPAGQVPGRRPPGRPGQARGPPREPRAHGTGSPDPESCLQGPGVQAAGPARRGPPRGLERPRKCRRRGRGRGLRVSSRRRARPRTGLEALSRGPAPPGSAAACPSGGAGAGGPRRREQVRGRGRSPASSPEDGPRAAGKARETWGARASRPGHFGPKASVNTLLGTDESVANFFNTAETLAGSWHLGGMQNPGFSRWEEVTLPRPRERGVSGAGKLAGRGAFRNQGNEARLGSGEVGYPAPPPPRPPRRLGPVLSHLPALREKTYSVLNIVAAESNSNEKPDSLRARHNASLTGSPGCPFAVSETEGFLKRSWDACQNGGVAREVRTQKRGLGRLQRGHWTLELKRQLKLET